MLADSATGQYSGRVGIPLARVLQRATEIVEKTSIRVGPVNAVTVRDYHLLGVGSDD